jgi:hypothetical protein
MTSTMLTSRDIVGILANVLRHHRPARRRRCRSAWRLIPIRSTGVLLVLAAASHGAGGSAIDVDATRSSDR